MKNLDFNSLRGRGFALAAGCLIFLVWNLALATQRKNLGGRFMTIKKENVLLKVNCPGKIEPKIFETVRSQLDGRKLGIAVKVGDSVKTGQVLMEISGEQIKLELVQKRTNTQNLKADLQKARKDYILEKNLFAQQAVPLVNVENAKDRYERARQAMQISLAELALVEKKALGVKVRSPMDGVIIKNMAEKEDWVISGRELFVVAKLDKFAVRGKVDELDIGRIKIGQDAIIQCSAFPNVEMTGKVSLVGAQAGEGAFAEIEVVMDILDSKGLELKPNLSADAVVITGEIKDGILIPMNAVRSGEKGPYVLARRLGAWVVKEPVKISQASSGQVVVDLGLEDGEAILIPKEE